MNFKFQLLTIISLLLFSSSVLAVPGLPHQFYGSVTLNGQPATDGTSIVAKINGVQVSSTTTSGGKYGYSPVFYVDDPNNDRTGKTINFFVNGVDTGQFSYFCNGCSTNLDLSVQIAQPSTPPSGGSSGGGGGGGTGGGATGGTGGTTPSTTDETTQSQQCQERWLCSDWSECKDGIQTRTCNDENNCGTNNNEPLTAQPCTIKKQETPIQQPTPTQKGGLRLSGMFVAITQNPIYLIFLVLVVAAVAFLFRNKIFAKK